MKKCLTSKDIPFEIKTNALILTLELLKHEESAFKTMLADMEFKEVFSGESELESLERLKGTKEVEALREKGVL